MTTLFNPASPTVLHVDLNSCFASIEQQANPLYRNKPLVVAAYTTGNGCILAASREAKKLGIKTGMPVAAAKAIYPRLIALSPDPEKYRWVNRALRKVLESYTPNLRVESIDEMVLSLENTPALFKQLKQTPTVDIATLVIAQEMKKRIKEEVGDWLTVSVGIAPNRYLAKVASGLHKPDGLDIITRDNIRNVFSTMVLHDLCGIKDGMSRRLNAAGIQTPVAFYEANAATLIDAFHSVVGYQWWMRLHGWEDGVLYKEFEQEEGDQKSFGQSHALGKPKTPSDPGLHQILSQLVVKMCRRLRQDGYATRGVGVSCFYRDGTFWRYGHKGSYPLYDSRDIYEITRLYLDRAPEKLVHILAVNTFDLEKQGYGQLPLLEEDQKKQKLVAALDTIYDRWGDFTIVPGRMLNMQQKVLDRIAFGKIRELHR